MAAIYVLFGPKDSFPRTLTHAFRIKTQLRMGLLAPCFALLLPFLVLCRTVSIDLANPDRGPTLSGSLATFILSQTNSTLAANLAQNQTVNSDVETFDYDIPNTSRYVDIAIDKDAPLDPASFHGVITTTLSRLTRHIEVHGDGRLQPQDNPYVITSGNCSSETEADLQPDGTPWLTYKILLETFTGLKVILDDEGRYFTAGFSTASTRGRAYGKGSIYGAPHAAGPASTSLETEK